MFLKTAAPPISTNAANENLAQVLDALLSSNRLFRTFTRTSVGLGALTANGQTATMTNTAIAGNFLQTLNVLKALTTKVTFHRILIVKQ